MTGAVYWPNGMGYRECSAEYADAYEGRQAAADKLKLVDETSPLYPALVDSLEFAQMHLDGLKAEGGHLGRVVRFDAYDETTAQLGGGRIREMA
jgi:hypothetical protein